MCSLTLLVLLSGKNILDGANEIGKQGFRGFAWTLCYPDVRPYEMLLCFSVRARYGIVPTAAVDCMRKKQ